MSAPTLFISLPGVFRSDTSNTVSPESSQFGLLQGGSSPSILLQTYWDDLLACFTSFWLHHTLACKTSPATYSLLWHATSQLSYSSLWRRGVLLTEKCCHEFPTWHVLGLNIRHKGKDSDGKRAGRGTEELEARNSAESAYCFPTQTSQSNIVNHFSLLNYWNFKMKEDIRWMWHIWTTGHLD